MLHFPTSSRRLLLPTAMLAIAALVGCSSLDGPGDLRDIERTSGAVITGVVRDTGGRAAEDAVVTLETMVAGRAASVAARSGLGDDLAAAKSSRIRSIVTDATGHYAFDGVTAGDYLLTTSLRDHAGATNRLDIGQLAAANAETTVVDIQLVPTGTILGTATRENATDHSGTIVFVDGTSYVAITDAGGAYSLTGVPIGTQPVHATYPGFLDDTTTAMLSAAGDSVTAGALFLRLSANIPPVIDSVGATAEIEGTPTTFSAAAHDVDGSIALWEWDFQNDGVFDWSSAIGAAAMHAYPAPGDYLAKLRVTDNQGGFGLAVVNVSVLAAPSGTIFVTETGSDANPGSASSPVRSIAKGLALAQAAAMDSVFVAVGEYPAVVDLVDGISIYGGRDALNWSAGAGYSHVTGSTRPLRGTGITAATSVEGLHIESIDAVTPGEASVAVTLQGCGSLLVFTDCIITAGAGASGLDGTAGAPGASGSNGGTGLVGQCDNTPSRPGGSGGGGFRSGGTGGAGGNASSNGANGSTGGTGGGGTPGGGGGSTGNPGSSAGIGGTGINGAPGSGGTAAGVPGAIAAGIWQATVAGNGSIGQGGNGGGGGGGGGGQTGFLVIEGVGGSGGGGGGGGFPGQPGTGGHGGGASIGFLLIASTPVINLCTINTGLGGDGGAGGAGGAGGNRGLGGSISGRDCSDVGLGGNGGNGGFGGAGGGGAGGWGGPSFGLLYASGSNVSDTTSITFVIGAGGSGGSGGTSTGLSGQAGPSGPSANIGTI